MELIVVWIVKTLIFAVSVFFVAHIIPGIRVKNFAAAFVVAVVYGIFNFIAYKVFFLFTLPFGYLTLGLGFWIINSILLVLTDKVVDSFKVSGLFSAAIGSLLISVINLGLSKFIFELPIFVERLSRSGSGINV